MIDTDDE